ncbi:MAG TPA: iron-sulfur cluster carrier protein MrpORP [Spirochaetota bacterium]|nr:iron-sulfur cluster carrier protein MrpORP [Spirochaetota bacterium]HOS34077.1 iron-sulfur cluster carrier protein MrpORP [Spirochaetota bacterium]HOS56659.1 iron-sulfur cluster carrier protein MrpORP [Spirochaetota bacterium]HPK62901.1 iron-sulfur cluster carrier protein MrpORP [Spirochaetota bacterium]HQF78243.1 iron-sulfur cluster carrier protein MrpORP [Spirochaetota bacterium]
MHQNDEQNRDMLRMENLQKIKNTIVVISGKGGVGKSTVSVNIAYALALQGRRVGIMDVDIHGPSIAKMTGIDNKRLVSEEEGKRPRPIEAVHNLFVLSIASMLESPDEAIIWRGPMKMGVIRQFLEDIDWPELDYLVVDCPPGTGDEPLSVIQLIGDVTGVVVVTTPQDVALLDVRKSINFVKKLETPILGIVENMAGFVCPKCGEKVDIFKSGGAEKVGKSFNVEVLGSIPIDGNIVNSGDEGKPYVYHYGKTEGGKIFSEIAEKLMVKIDKQCRSKNTFKAAMPLENGKLSEHFGHAKLFGIFTVEDKKIAKYEELTPPPHDCESIPKWLNELGVEKVIVKGIGDGAIKNLALKNIKAYEGDISISKDELVQKLIDNSLKLSRSNCSGAGCGHRH